MPETKPKTTPARLNRRDLLAVFPAGAAACAPCLRPAACAPQTSDPAGGHSWAEKADITWEQMCRFAYRKDLIPLLQAMAGQIGREPFLRMLREGLWAKVFREENAADIEYAMVCYPDYAVSRGLNPKWKLIWSKTLMQGDDGCVLRYVMEA